MADSKLNIFDYTRGISQTKQVEYASNVHNTYMINTILSMHKETLGFANIVNHFGSYMSDKLIFDFLFHSIPPKKRWAKYVKTNKIEVDSVITKVAKSFNISHKQAKEYLKTYQS